MNRKDTLVSRTFDKLRLIEIKLILTHFEEPISTPVYDYYLSFLSDDLKVKNGRYRRWQDRHTHLFGKMLLIHLAKEFGLDGQVLSQLSYSQHDRPFLKGPLDFNISHTGTTVACAIARDAKVGLDIEQYTEIDFSDFQKIHSREQWDQINAAQDPQKAFFEFWTIKESVIKADGKGLSLPLDKIVIDKDRACQENQTWYLKQLDLEKHMACCVACDQPDFEITVERITEEQIYARCIG